MAVVVADEQRKALECIEQISTSSARERMRAELNDLIVRHGSAASPEKEAIEAQIVQLRRDARIAATVNLWSWASIGLVGLATIAFFGGIFLYIYGLGPARYSSIEATRPVLVFTLIIAMLGFGGLLIARALFSNLTDEQFERRFRSAREIFLVFAGIFGTIIGFYFGAGDEEAGVAPTVTVSHASGQVTAAVEGGAAPFLAIYTPPANGGDSQVKRSSERALNFTAACQAGATVLVIDGAGRQASGSVTCPSPGSAGEAQPNRTNIVGNAALPNDNAGTR
jgi:hypothetical protein